MTDGLRTMALWIVGISACGPVGRAAAQPTQHRVAPSLSLLRSDTADAATQGLLLDGVRAFRAERYEEALQLFHRVKSQHRLQDIGFYEGMALHKLGRHAEALVAFRAAHRQGLREPIADYYQAVSCYRLGMMARALREFSALLPQGSTSATAAPLGPRLTLGVQQFVRAIEQAGHAGLRPSDSPTEGLRGRFEPPAQRTTQLNAVLASAESALLRSAEEAVEWLDEAAELLPSVSKIPTYRLRFRELLLRVRSVAEAAGGGEPGAPPGPTASELNLLWCRIAGSADCAL